MAEEPDRLVEGTVIRSTGSWHDVQTDDGPVPCRVRGKFRLAASTETSPVVVGDRVQIRLNPDETGWITGISERTSSLLRRAAGKKIGRAQVIAANVNHAWVVQAWREPNLNAGFVDRFLVMAASNDLPAGIIVNKIDLVADREDRAALKEWKRLYEALGYEVLTVSAATGKGMRSLRRRLRGEISVMAGPSGVGKTTLLNLLSPAVENRTGEISAATGKGIHTTTVASLHPLEGPGFIVDTPGLREFGLIGLDPPHLSHYFPDMAALLPECRFPNCTHDHEPGCAVKDAVDDGTLPIARYDSYLGMLYSLHLGDGDVGR